MLSRRSNLRAPRKSRIGIIGAGLVAAALVFAADIPSRADEPAKAIVAGTFSAANPDGTPEGWRRKDFKNQSRFTIIEDAQMNVLRAESHAAASGLFREIAVDSQEFPVVRWRWKVSRVVAAADEREKRADDAAARVFVIFKDSLPGAGVFSRLKHKLAAAGGAVSPGVSLCYIWSNRLPQGQVIRSPYTEWVGIIAADQGPEKAGTWVTVERNVRDDFRRVFGAEPKEIAGVAVMTDTDNTGEAVTAFYSTIFFDKKFSKPEATAFPPRRDALRTMAIFGRQPGVRP